MNFKGYEIRKSGKDFWKVLDENNQRVGDRSRSIEAAQASILSKGRVMTRKEHSLVHGSNPNHEPTAPQAESEAKVKSGLVEGFI